LLALYLVEIMKIAVISLIVILSAISACAQTRTAFRLYRPCPGVGQQARVEITRPGDIDLVPCTGRSLLVNGVPLSSGPTLSGTGRTYYFPYFSTETNLDKSPLKWDSFKFTFNNPAEDSPYKMVFQPSTFGLFHAGGNVADYIDYDFKNRQFNVLVGEDGVGEFSRFWLSPTNGRIQTNFFMAGDWYGMNNGTRFSVKDDIKTFFFGSAANDALMYLDGVKDFRMNRQLTITGCGGMTINKPVGTVIMCTGAASLMVTNDTVNADSIIIPVARTYDANCSVKAIEPSNGSFVVYMTAPCAGDTSIGFLVLN